MRMHAIGMCLCVRVPIPVGICDRDTSRCCGGNFTRDLRKKWIDAFENRVKRADTRLDTIGIGMCARICGIAIIVIARCGRSGFAADCCRINASSRSHVAFETIHTIGVSFTVRVDISSITTVCACGTAIRVGSNVTIHRASEINNTERFRICRRFIFIITVLIKSLGSCSPCIRGCGDRTGIYRNIVIVVAKLASVDTTIDTSRICIRGSFCIDFIQVRRCFGLTSSGCGNNRCTHITSNITNKTSSTRIGGGKGVIIVVVIVRVCGRITSDRINGDRASKFSRRVGIVGLNRIWSNASHSPENIREPLKQATNRFEICNTIGIC